MEEYVRALTPEGEISPQVFKQPSFKEWKYMSKIYEEFIEWSMVHDSLHKMLPRAYETNPLLNSNDDDSPSSIGDGWAEL